MKAGLPPTLTPTQRGQTGKHIHTHTALTHTYSVFLPHANTCTVGSWMYMIIGTCVHTHARVQYMLHIYIQTHIHTHTIYTYAKWNGTIFFSWAVFHVAGQAAVLHCVCVFIPTEGQWKGLLQFTEMWRNKERERTRARGNKLNGEWGQKKRKERLGI